MSIKVGHDGMARIETKRETVKTTETCSFCGQNNKGRLYRYYTTSDDSLWSRKNYLKGKFCSIGCCNSYHC